MKAIKQYTGFSVRRPGRKRGPAADIDADVISRHKTARLALVSLRAQPRDPAGGYSNDFVFCEKQQRRLSNYEADK